jgi:hypothetical protein
MMKRTCITTLLVATALLVCLCKNKSQSSGGMDAIDKTVAQDKLYNQCTENMANLIKHIGLYKKYNQKPPASLTEIEKEYNLKACCPMTGAAYEFKSIIPQPGEEINNENIQAFYDEPAKRTFKIICPSHHLTQYGD